MTVEDLRINLSKGPRGESAYEVAVRHGYVGTEEQWLASLEGKSAYQIAVELGYVGTEAEWLASLKGAKGDDGRDADIWTIGEDDFWYVNGRKTIFKSRGEDGKAPLLRISTDGQSLEISSDGGQTWLPFEKNFNKLRVLGYVSSVQLLPRNANIGDIYGVWNPDVYSGRVDEEGHLIKGAYDLYVNTVRDWVDDYHITKVYDYDTELPSSAANGTTVLVPVDYLTLDKTKIDGYKVYRFSLDRNGWVLILDTAEIYASKDDIINYGDNVFALVQSEEEHTYELYRRDVGWVYFGTNASITYVLVQDVNEGTETNILSGKAIKDAYGRYIESPEFIRAYLDDEDKILWGIKTDGTIYFGAGVPPQVKDYIEERIGNYDNIITFLDDLEEGDETLRELLNGKVDKEEGKSLINEEFANGIHYEESPEFIEIKLDGENKILEAIYKDGTKLLPAGYDINGVTVNTVNNPEFLAVWLDNSNHILFALEKDGNAIFAAGVPKQIIEYVSEIIKPFEELFHFENNPEFVETTLDVKGKIAEATKTDGTKVLPAGVETPKVAIEGITIESTNNPEYIDIKTDFEGKILEGVRNDGTKVIGNLKILSSLDINGITYSVVSNPEWLKAVIDSENKIICGIKADGTFCVVDIDFLDSSNKIKEVLNHFDVKDNPEFLSVELDAEGKILGGRKADGTKFENVRLDLDGAVLKGMKDPEGRMEVKTDSEQKIINYRKDDGTLVENVGIETNHLELTEQGMTDFQQALKDSGFNPGGNGDWSDAKSIEIPIPRCAIVNITSPSGDAVWPQAKGVNLKYYIQFYDMQGNYFKKEIIFNAQGNSSMQFAKKNGAVDICNNNGWDDDDTFSIKFGDWVAQDSFHFKSYYTDYLRGGAVIAYQVADEVYKTRGVYADRPWKKALIDFSKILSTTPAGLTEDGTDDVSLQIDNGARCMPDGFPAIFYLNGEFYGIFAWQLKKHRDNYHMNKKTAEHIQLDGDLYASNLWGGTINWTAFEVRNPKNLYCMDGSKYDGDNPKELIDSTSQYYDSTNKDHKTTAKVKQYIINLSNRVGEINTLNSTNSAAAKELFDTYFDADSIIDYQLINMAVNDPDGFGKNWQWTTWDGVKWYVNQYDKDMALGNHHTGMFTRQPSNGGWMNNDVNLPTGLAIRYYTPEHKIRWNDLVNAGILTVNNITSKINEWVARVGQDNYEKEWEKWSESPCNRDSGIDYENWRFTGGYSQLAPTGGTIWNESDNYNIGQKVWYHGTDYLEFEAIQANTNKRPLTITHNSFPTVMGYRDSMWRYIKFIEVNIQNQNNFINNL